MALLPHPQARRSLRRFLCVLALFSIPGCKYQHAHLIKPQAENMVGSHAAGAEVFDPLVEEAIAKLLARQTHLPANTDPSLGIAPKSVCFVGVENKSAEELGDFKEQLYQQIDAHVGSSDAFAPLSRRMVDAALRETRLRPDSLMVPSNQRLFAEVLEREGSPIDYLLFATLTSGTTKNNGSSQRDYLLTLELVDLHTGTYQKEMAEVRKGYHKSLIGRWLHSGRGGS
jgi:hypothetical protein